MIILSVFFAIRVQNLRFNYDFEAFFPNEDNELELYNQYRQKFEYDNEFILIGLENKKGIFDSAFLKKVNDLSERLSVLKDIKQITSPTQLKKTVLGGLVPIQLQVLHFDNPNRYKSDSVDIYQSENLIGSYFALDGKSISLFAKTEDALSKAKSDALAKAVQVELAKFQFDDVHVVGRIFAQQVYLENIRKEFFLFLTISFVLVLLFLWFTFKKLYGVIVPVSIVLVSILWTLGIMQLMGKSIDVMAIMLPTMIFVAGMSDVVHFFSRYFEESAKKTSQKEIFKIILKEVAFPTFLTLLTTVVGFLSLLFSSIGPVRDFGIYISVGVTVAFVLTYTLLPAIIQFFPPKQTLVKKVKLQKSSPIMGKLLLFVFRWKRSILIVSTFILLVSAYGISRIKINNILLEDLNDKVRIKQDFIFFDQHFSGVRPLELQITLTLGKKILDYENMKALDHLDQFVKKEYDAGFLISPASIIREIHKNSQEISTNAFPDDEEYLPLKELLYSNRKNKDLRKILSPDGQSARITAKTRDIGSYEIKKHNEHLEKYIKENMPADLQINITGAAHLLDRNNEYMVNNMAQGFAFSLLIISLLTLFIHRSWKMVLVFLIPNLVPLIVIAGIMGYLGIELKAATSLIFSIAFGIATDDTIHFISRLKIELSYKKSLLYALKRTFLETGKPIVLTTFILVGGFLSLMTSNFESTFYFGFLICVTMIVALAADLLLLPILLLILHENKRSTSKI